MKKYLYLVLVVCLPMLVMSSCSKDDDDDKSEPSTNPLVGTWKCLETGEIGLWTSIITFKPDYTWTGHTIWKVTNPIYGDEDAEWTGGGTYAYSQSTSELIMVTAYDSDGDCEYTDVLPIILGDNFFKIDTADEDDRGHGIQHDWHIYIKQQ